MIQRLAIFCGSSAGNNPIYKEEAYQVGKLLAERGIEVVYGGGKVGLMGVVADAALEHGGKVIGVIPEKLMEWEVGHNGLTELHIVKTMHERKAMMAKCRCSLECNAGGNRSIHGDHCYRY